MRSQTTTALYVLLMAAVIMRMVPRRSLSLARIAAFMSSVMRSLSDIDVDGNRIRAETRPSTGEPGAGRCGHR